MRIMTLVDIPKRRSVLLNSSEGIEYTIPNQKNWFFIFFLCLFMVWWSALEIALISHIISTEGGFKLNMIPFIGLWTIFGFLAFFTWLWNLWGKERIILRSDALITKKEVFGIGRTHKYEITNIHNLRTSRVNITVFILSHSLAFWPFGGGLIAFDYRAKTIRCGSDIDESEASDIVKELLSKYNFNNNAG
jgi:hypothetical protein